MEDPEIHITEPTTVETFFGGTLVLDVHLILKHERLDSTPTTRTDMFVKGQRITNLK